MVECKKCGKCCIVFDKKNERWIKCPFLNKDNLCIIYKVRIGAHLGHKAVCGYRKDLHYNIPGCPYNMSDYMTHPAYIDKKISKSP